MPPKAGHQHTRPRTVTATGLLWKPVSRNLRMCPRSNLEVTGFVTVEEWPCSRRPACPYHTFHMDYYLLEYALVDDYLARRAAFREVHLALAREAHRRGELILAGALAEPPDRAVFVWRTDDRSVVESFADGDPYVRNGLVTSWTIRPWTVVIGEAAGLC